MNEPNFPKIKAECFKDTHIGPGYYDPFESKYECYYDWNVIDESTFKHRVRSVFSQVASALVKTLGPYGSTTIIEKYGEMAITKDGWQVLKKISFNEALNNHILHLLLQISAQVVIKVGDGSTSSIIAADSILKQLEECEDLKKIRPKELMNTISRCVEKISTDILNKSVKIDNKRDPEYDDIYKLAMIATNGNNEVSTMIQQIYIDTENPSIEFIKSKTNKTSYEIVEGYKALITYLDSIFATNDSGTCEIEKPLILMFDHKIELDHHKKIIKDAIQIALSSNRQLVVIAPYYDKHLLNMIAQSTTLEMKANGNCTTIYARVSIINNNTSQQYNDFCMMTGGLMITESTIDNLFEKKITIDDFIGEVDKISIGEKSTLINGFFKRQPHMYKLFKNDAISKYNEVEESHMQRGIVNSELYDIKQRISKLSGKMGIIHIGGYSNLEKDSNYDLVEDAVKACESAFNYGYNIGGNLIIPITIKDILENDLPLTQDEKKIMELLLKAFSNVFIKVLYNKFKLDEIELEDIVNTCINKKECFDLICNKYSTDIINSCFTDIEILKASTSIISLLISSNQYISIPVLKEQ